ncbi:hypothetical protein Tco_0980622 [Tanacetum coccineum]
MAPTHADLLPPRKRFRDSYSFEASIEEDTEIVDPIETKVDMELGVGDGDDVRDHIEIDLRDVRDNTEEYEANTNAGDTVKVGNPMFTPIVEEEIVELDGEDSSNSFGTRDGIVRSFEDIPIDLDDVVRDFYHHMSEVRIDRIVGIETTHEATCAANALETENQSQNGSDGDNGNGGNGNGRNENPNENGRGLIRWFEKMEIVFHISNCPEKSQVKYATCTLLDGALTWWNSHKRTIVTEAAFSMS